MANDDQNDQQDQHEESDEEEHANPGGKQGESSGTKGGFQAITSQEDLDRIIRTRLTRDRKKQEQEIREAIEAETKAAAAKEQGDYKKLYEDQAAKLKELEAKEATRELLDRKRAAARKHNLPDEMAARLNGETDEDLEEDAKALAKLVTNRDAPETDGDRRTTTKPNKSKTNDPLTDYEFGKRQF